MRAATWLALGALATIILIVGVLVMGWFISRVAWAPMGGQMRNGGGRWSPWGRESAPCVLGRAPAATESSINLTASAVESAFLSYLHSLGYDELVLTEVMEFEHNYYAISSEPDAEVGAMELLLDKATGDVGPEIGPNMMWNTVYGMHGGMMRGWGSRESRLTPEAAIAAAERWLETYRPGERSEAHADAFHGYYTLHTVDASGDIVGMLSVHGETGQVWYHTWHGQFIAMLSDEPEDH